MFHVFVVVAAVIPVVADVDVVGTGQKRAERKKKKTEKEPGRHNYKLHRYTQITRLFCASQPPGDHAVYVSSVVAREQREKETERARNTERIQPRWEKTKKGREREKARARSAHNYRLYFQIAACELAASSNCSRHWIFIARAWSFVAWHGAARSRVPTLSAGQTLAIVDTERTGGYAFALNPFR